MFLLVLADPDSPRQRAIRRLFVNVCVCVCVKVEVSSNVETAASDIQLAVEVTDDAKVRRVVERENHSVSSEINDAADRRISDCSMTQPQTCDSCTQVEYV